MTETIESKTDAPQSDGETKSKTNSEKVVVAAKVKGVVKWYNVKTSFGFITRDDTKEDIFVHQTSLNKRNTRKVTRSVNDGEQVEFDVVLGDKGHEAANVTGPNDGPLIGSKYAQSMVQYYRNMAYKKRRGGGGQGGDGAPRSAPFRRNRNPKPKSDSGENDNDAGSDAEATANDNPKNRRQRKPKGKSESDGNADNDERVEKRRPKKSSNRDNDEADDGNDAANDKASKRNGGSRSRNNSRGNDGDDTKNGGDAQEKDND